MILNVPQSLAEPLEMDHLPLPQEADRIADIVVFDHPQDIVIGGAGLLLGCQILKEIRNWVAFGLELTGIEGDAACRLGPDACGVVNIVGTKAGFFDFLGR